MSGSGSVGRALCGTAPRCPGRAPCPQQTAPAGAGQGQTWVTDAGGAEREGAGEARGRARHVGVAAAQRSSVPFPFTDAPATQLGFTLQHAAIGCCTRHPPTAQARQWRPPSPQTHVTPACYSTTLQYLDMGTIPPLRDSLLVQSQGSAAGSFCPADRHGPPCRNSCQQGAVWGCDARVCQSMMGTGPDYDGVAAPDPPPIGRRQDTWKNARSPHSKGRGKRQSRMVAPERREREGRWAA